MSLFAVLTVFAVAFGLLAAGALHGGRAAAAAGHETVVPQTDDSIPAREVTMFGASPAEAGGEVWGIGKSHGSTAIVHYTAAGGWSVVAGPLNKEGAPLDGFELDHPEPGRFPAPSPLAGSVTPNGSTALLGTAPGSGQRRDVMLIRNPGGAFTEVAPPPQEGAAAPGEVSLAGEELFFGFNRAPLIAALEEPGSKAGALVVPVEEGGKDVEDSVLHWSGESKQWTREQIEVPAESSGEFQVLAIGASSPTNAWLLAELSTSYPTGSVALFRRHVEGETASWRPVEVDGGEAGAPLTVPLGEKPALHDRRRHPVADPDRRQRRRLAGRAARRSPVLDDDVLQAGRRRTRQDHPCLVLCPEGKRTVHRDAARTASHQWRTQLRLV